MSLSTVVVIALLVAAILLLGSDPWWVGAIGGASLGLAVSIIRGWSQK